jgi:hypothetical protein
MGPCIANVFQYISNKMQNLHSLFIFGNCCIYFGWYFHPSSGAHTTVSTASGIWHVVAAICRYRGRVGTCLSVCCEWRTPPTAQHTQTVSNYSTIAADSSNGVTNTRCCRYSLWASDDGWRYHPQHVEQFPDINKLCKVAPCWIYIGIDFTRKDLFSSSGKKVIIKRKVIKSSNQRNNPQ